MGNSAKAVNKALSKPMPRQRGVIGLIVPSLNTVMEQEFHRAAPDGIAICTARYLCAESEGTNTFGMGKVALSIENMKKGVGLAARELSTVPYLGVVVFGCTSGSFVDEEGRIWGDELTALIQGICGVEAFSASTAVLKALRELGVSNIGLVTPYPEPLHEEARSFLEDNGIAVRRDLRLDVPRGEPASSLSLAERYEGLRAVATDAGCEALFVSCTGLATFDLIDRAERDFQRPVISSNQACFWLAFNKLGTPFQGRLGTLFTRMC